LEAQQGPCEGEKAMLEETAGTSDKTKKKKKKKKKIQFRENNAQLFLFLNVMVTNDVWGIVRIKLSDGIVAQFEVVFDFRQLNTHTHTHTRIRKAEIGGATLHSMV
jgi:hypothetical protein